MKVLLVAIALIGFVSLNSLAQEEGAPAPAGAAMDKGGDREPAKSKHKKGKKKKHSKKSKQGM